MTSLNQKQVVLMSGDRRVAFTVDADDVHAGVTNGIRKYFEVESQDDLPPLSYLDEEGDTIVLNLGVAVEFEEAVRVQGDSLEFTLQHPLPFRPRPALVPTTPKKEIQAHVAVPPAFATADINSVEDSNDDNDMLDVLAQVKTVMQNFQSSAKRTENELRQQLAVAKAENNRAQAQLRALEKDRQTELSALKKDMKSAQGLVAEYRKRETTLRQQVATTQETMSSTAEALKSAQEEVARCRQEATQNEADKMRARANHTLEKQSLQATISAQTQETKSLVEEIAGHRVELSTAKLEIADLKKENEALQTKLDEVYAALRTLQPLMGNTGVAPKPAVPPAPKLVIPEEAPKPKPEMPKDAAPKDAAPKDAAPKDAPKDSMDFVFAMDQAEACTNDLVASLKPQVNKRSAPRKRSVAMYPLAVTNAHATITGMGFPVSMGAVKSLMSQYKNDVQRVIEHLLTNDLC